MWGFVQYSDFFSCEILAFHKLSTKWILKVIANFYSNLEMLHTHAWRKYH